MNTEIKAMIGQDFVDGFTGEVGIIVDISDNFEDMRKYNVMGLDEQEIKEMTKDFWLAVQFDDKAIVLYSI